MSPLDQDRLAAALVLAEHAIGLSDPNPRVGCIIGTEDGKILGQGHTQQAGGPHAEVMALRDAQSHGHDVRGTTAWVTLEPCAHHGRTPPCCDALAAAGMARVVVAIKDPFPQVAGQGIAHLRAAGVDVVLADPAIAERAREINIGFFSRFERGRPWVRLKVAGSMDGRTALPNGRSQWITGNEARLDGHRWRRRASAVATGIGTILADDPRLDVRLVDTAQQPIRIVFDSHIALPPDARIISTPGRCWLLTSGPADSARAQSVMQMGVELLTIPPDLQGRPDLPIALSRLAARGINELHLEGGARLNGAFLAAGLADEIVLYIAPTIIGPGRGLAEWPELNDLEQAPRFKVVDSRPIGGDWCFRLRPIQSSDSRGSGSVGALDSTGSAILNETSK